MSFDALRKNRNKIFDKYREESEKENSNSWSDEDDRFWKVTTDKNGTGSAIIRFLPQVDGDMVPWVRTFSHGFQGHGGWYIENCPTTLPGKQKCPVCESNSQLWNSGVEANQEIVRKYRKRRLSYIANIYVVKDPGNPENQGKVFLFRFGKKIWNKINEKMHPEEGLGEKPINPFDFWDGCNFVLKVQKVEGYPNYDSSYFQNPKALSDDDAVLKEIYEQENQLAEFVHPDKFKPYDELKARLDHVLGVPDSSSVYEQSSPKPREESKGSEAAKIDFDEDPEMMKELEDLINDE